MTEPKSVDAGAPSGPGPGRFSIGLVGDTLLTRHIAQSDDQQLLKLREVLRAAEGVFTNLEAPVHNYLDGPHAQRNGGGTYMTTEPALLDDLKWLNINLIACGSSHADDYGPAGLLETIRHLDAAGIAHAGSGRHLAESRAPGYLDLRNGRVALIAANAQFRPGARAGEQRYDTAGGPGINGLRHRTEYVVNDEQVGQLRSVARTLGQDVAEARARFQGDPEHEVGRDEVGRDEVSLLGHRFVAGPEPAIRTFADPSDLEENGRQVRNAAAMADLVLVSLHCHDQGGPTLLTARRRADVEDIADFAVEFGRRCIDEGADIFVAHGPQVPLGIEIYRGKPLFHGLGSFLFQIETVKYLPAEAYERFGLDERATPSDFINTRYRGGAAGHLADPAQWEQVAVICDYDDGRLSTIRLFPIELGHRLGRTRRGTPRLAERDVADRVLDRLARLSKPFGTVIDNVDGVGVITLP